MLITKTKIKVVLSDPTGLWPFCDTKIQLRLDFGTDTMYTLLLISFALAVRSQHDMLPPVKSCFEECEELWCGQQDCQPTTVVHTATIEPSTLTTTLTHTETDLIYQTITQFRPKTLTQMRTKTKTDTTTVRQTSTVTMTQTSTVTETISQSKVKRNASILSSTIFNHSAENSPQFHINPSRVANGSDNDKQVDWEYHYDDNRHSQTIYDSQDPTNGLSTDNTDNDWTDQVYQISEDIDNLLEQAEGFLHHYFNVTIKDNDEPLNWLRDPFNLIQQHPQITGDNSY